jgi:hypothetical protein
VFDGAIAPRVRGLSRNPSELESILEYLSEEKIMRDRTEVSKSRSHSRKLCEFLSRWSKVDLCEGESKRMIVMLAI